MSADESRRLLIVYHSQSGTCASMARAAARGARRETGVHLQVCRAWNASVEHLACADGLLLVAAENSGALSGGMKDFLDRTFYPAIARGLVVPYGLLVSAGNDGTSAQSQAQRILRGYPFPAATQPVIQRGEFCQAAALICEEFGEAFATGLSMGIY